MSNIICDIDMEIDDIIDIYCEFTLQQDLITAAIATRKEI